MNGLTFDEATHTYMLGRRILPSVSAIIRPISFAGLEHVHPETLARAAEFGTAVHKITEDFDTNGSEDVGLGVPNDVHQCLHWWLAFCRDYEVRHLHVEARLYHGLYGYAGTLDRLSIVRDEPAIIDIKTSEPHAWHGVQLAGYAAAALDRGLIDSGAVRRYGVYLDPDRAYRVREYTLGHDFLMFNALRVQREWHALTQGGEAL